MGELMVKARSGQLRGRMLHDGVCVFKGIPYGRTSAGAARFRPPGPPPEWSGVRDALTYGPACPQPFGAAPGPPVDEADAARRRMFEVYGMPLREEVQSEDCLVLNVWTPGL